MALIGIDGNRPLDDAGRIAPQIRPAIVAGTGAEFVRVNFVLGPFASPDESAWVAAYEELIGGMVAAGVKVFGLVGHEVMREQPGAHFRSPAESQVARAWVEEYVRRFRAIADRFAGRVIAFESINEPNDWQGGQEAWAHARWYAHTLARVYQVVKPAGVTLVSGPLFTHDIGGAGDDGSAYLRQTYRLGREVAGWDAIRAETGSFPLDGVGVHLYVAEGADSDENAVRRVYQERLDRLIATVDAIDGSPGQKALYVTEFGFPGNADDAASQDRQARKTAAALDVLRAHPRVALASLFCMHDFPGKPYGVYRTGDFSDAHRKPVFERFRVVALAERSDGGGEIPDFTSPNRGGRRSQTRGVIVHSTQGNAATLAEEFRATIDNFANPASEVSTHAVIGPNGEVARPVHPDLIAFHARSFNLTHLGIELVQSRQGDPIPAATVAAAARVVAEWCTSYGIPIERGVERGIAEHREIPPGIDDGKSDVGPPFDLDAFITMVRAAADQTPVTSILNRAEVRLYASWALESLENGDEEIRGEVGLRRFRAHLRALGKNDVDAFRYGWPIRH